MRAATSRVALSCLALSGLVLAAGCGGDKKDSEASNLSPGATSPSEVPTPGASGNVATTPLTKAQLTQAGLALTDLPGFQPDPDAIENDVTGCAALDAMAKQVRGVKAPKQAANLDLAYKKSDNGPFVDESLASFRTGGVEPLYGQAIAAVTSCKQFVIAGPNGSVTLQNTKVTDAPTYGDASVVFRQQGTLQGVPLMNDMIFSRMDSVLVLVQVGAIGNPVPAGLEQQTMQTVTTKLGKAISG